MRSPTGNVLREAHQLPCDSRPTGTHGDNGGKTTMGATLFCIANNLEVRGRSEPGGVAAAAACPKKVENAGIHT